VIVVGGPIDETALNALGRLGPVRQWSGDRPIPPETLRDWIRTADACLATLNDRIDGTLLAGVERLKIVANLAVGYDNLDLEALSARGILATNTPDVLTEATAELTWALILAVTRGILPAREAMLEGQWTHWRADAFLGTELDGLTLGIVGLGRIGRAVARRGEAFGMRIAALGREGVRPNGTEWERLPLGEFLRTADVVTIHVPLTPSTENLVNAAWFAAMKPGAYLINTSRGPVVDESALWDALNSGRLAGAGLDVFAHEPVRPGMPLITHPRVVATPHIGSATHATRRRMALRAVGNIRAALSGERPPDLLNPFAWENSGR
jgi:glyoxylate reductase